jgi:hypothetical protein
MKIINSRFDEDDLPEGFDGEPYISSPVEEIVTEHACEECSSVIILRHSNGTIFNLPHAKDCPFSENKLCKHTELNECKCSCHDPTETGEPAVIHMINCCEPCFVCGRNVNLQPEGITT